MSLQGIAEGKSHAPLHETISYMIFFSVIKILPISF